LSLAVAALRCNANNPIVYANQAFELIYYLGTQYDVTEQVRAEDEPRRLNALLAEVDR